MQLVIANPEKMAGVTLHFERDGNVVIEVREPVAVAREVPLESVSNSERFDRRADESR